MQITQLGCSVDTGSSKQKQQKNFSHLPEVVPANRSYLASDKLLQNIALKQSSNKLSMGKKLIIPGLKSTQSGIFNTMSLSKHVSSDENSGQLMASCSLKKPRLLITEQTGYGEESPGISTVNKNVLTGDLTVSLENEKPMWSGDKCQRNVGDRKRLLDKGMMEQNSGAQFIEQKDKGAESGSANEEKKGSDFLIQVKGFATFVPPLLSNRVKFRRNFFAHC